MLQVFLNKLIPIFHTITVFEIGTHLSQAEVITFDISESHVTVLRLY